MFWLFTSMLLLNAGACRWALFAGDKQREISAADFMTTPNHSLVAQSGSQPYLPGIAGGLFFKQSQLLLRNHDINRDGWGIGWYESRGNSTQVHRSRSANGASVPSPDGTQPFMVDRSLAAAAESVRSNVIFGHIRAATDGQNADINAHPFKFGNLLWMHNGGVANFGDIHPKLLRRLTPGIKKLIAGDTDSEILGALFMQHLTNPPYNSEEVHFQQHYSLSAMRQAMVATLKDVKALSRGAGASLNFAVTDGRGVVAIRYRSDPNQDPPSLYFSLGDEWQTKLHKNSTRMLGDAHWQPHQRTGIGKALMVASEPLYTTFGKGSRSGAPDGDWVLLAKDQMLSYSSSGGKLELHCLSPQCMADVAHRASAGSGQMADANANI